MVSGESGVSTISIHAPTRGATNMDMSVPSIRTNFNPRSHKGSDDNSSDRAWFVSSISIHAPTRGATTGNGSITFYCYISIHAPTRGATMEFYGNEDSRRFQSTLPQGERQFLVNITSKGDNFNPRSHKGSDIAIMLTTSAANISIHAPTRGATYQIGF